MSAPLPSCSSPVAPGPARRRKLADMVGKSLRLAVMLVVIAFGALLVMTYREMLHETPAPSMASPPRNEATVDAPLLALLRPGAWVLGDSSWTVSVVDLSDPANAARLKSLGQARTNDAGPMVLEASLLDWLRRSQPQVIEGCRVYEVPAGPVRVRAVTEGRDKNERLRLVQLLWRQGNRPPQLLQAAPAPSTVRRGMAEGPLGPLPPETTVLARRWEDSGSVSAEVLRCPASWEECLRVWAEAGWSVQTLPSGETSVPFVLLSQGERKLHCCRLQGGAAGPSIVLRMSVAPSSTSQGNP